MWLQPLITGAGTEHCGTGAATERAGSLESRPYLPGAAAVSRKQLI